jgi:curved DNA-binding protein CbpA
MNYLPNYYQVLRVSEFASIEEIKKAYRRESKRCHPDLGGSHDEMILVIEAWEILSDSSKRMEYDQARKSPKNKDAVSRNEVNRRNASKKSQNYPKKWKEFERYMEDLIKDVKNASYGYTYQKTFGIYPKVENSNTGAMFIIVGGILGIILLSPIFASSASTPKMFLMSIIVPAMLGSWLGMLTHQWIKGTIS